MTQPLAALPLSTFDAEAWALFLDFDGTLVEVAERPDLVVMAAETRAALRRLQAVLQGALAVITGRDILDVDKYLEPLRLPVAGVHGLMRRDAEGRVHADRVDAAHAGRIAERLASFLARADGVVLEPKPGSLALHYRARPDLEEATVRAMEDAVADLAEVHLVRGKMIIEAKQDGSNKGGAVADFLAEPPFAGRTPVFAGDDVTDEDAFLEVARRGGVSIKVGGGDTVARYRCDGSAEFQAWLGALAGALAGGEGP